MTSSFEALKKSRESSLRALSQEVTKQSTNQVQRESDDRFWQPEVDKAGNGYAIVRFLPAPQGEDVPWVRFWDHGFQGPGGWYIENSLTSIGQNDPVAESNSKLWATGIEENREIARSRKRRLHYVANVLIVKDSANPENEGQVRLFKFGKKIFNKINAVMNPEFEDDQPMNPFDFWTGANFRIKIRNVEGYRNYDESSFAAPSKVHEEDAQIENLWGQEFALQEFLAPGKFKSYSELKQRLDKVLGLTSGISTGQETGDDSEDELPTKPASAGKTADEPKQTAKDKDLDYFRSLTEDDD